MPARLSSMELSPSSNPEVDGASRPSKRRSGRVVRKPETLDPSTAPKRKRVQPDQPSDGDDVDMLDASDEDDDEDESEPDEEEVREQKRKRRSNAKSKAPAKRAKTNGGATTTTLPMRPAAVKPTKPKKPKKARPSQIASAHEVGGLYGDVHGGEEALDAVAAEWLKRFHAHESKAVAEVVNLILRSTGCEIEVDEHDIEDPDHCVAKLTDIQDEFQTHDIVEYPLIAKSKTAAAFRHNLTGFINNLIQTIAATGLIVEQVDLIENIQVWVSSMSSAANRPFRHTAAVVALEIISALCAIGRKYCDSRAKSLRQREGEQKNKKVNKARVEDLQKAADEAGEHVTQVDSIIHDWFDTVFVHRYRDVDPRIRVDCVTYLSEWIILYPEQFLDGSHLRYLGWVLSDTNSTTRLELLKQLQKLFSDDSKLNGLRQFTERFRPRMVEIATRDAELNCRISAIELLDVLREKGMLEPDDIDTLGKLMFDAEPRVRKALVPFFAASVEDSCQVKADELGEETIEELQPMMNAADNESPNLDWLRIKSLAELLVLYDANDSSSKARKLDAGNLQEIISTVESRCFLAAQSLFAQLPVVKKWEAIAGYLLVDHSQSNQNAEDAEAQFRRLCSLADNEEVVLLDVLNASVKLSLTEVVEEGAQKKAKKAKAQIEEIRDRQEAAAQRLAVLIPRLLNKFGAAPEAASAVLRLERVLNLDIFQELRQDSTTYSSLLENINRQFLTHENQDVIAEARAALLHAKSFEELEEITDGKLQSLWDDQSLHLAQLCDGEDMLSRGSMDMGILHAISSTVLRISNLSSISDCTEPLEKTHTIKSSARRRPQTANHIISMSCLVDILSRATSEEELDPGLEAAEDTLITQSIKVLFFYFMWSSQALKTSSTSISLPTLTDRYEATLSGLQRILAFRHGTDALRVSAASTFLDVQTIIATLRQIPQQNPTLPKDTRDMLNEISSNARLPSATESAVLKLFNAAERDFARKTSKHLDTTPAEDDGPEDSSDEEDDRLDSSESSEDEEDPADPDDAEEAAQLAAEKKLMRKQRRGILAEQTLCGLAGRLVMAVFAGVVDDKGTDGQGGVVRRRLLRNRMRLGSNYKEVVAALDAPEKGRAKGKKSKKAQQLAKQTKPREEMVIDEDEDDEIVAEEGTAEDLRQRELLVDGEIESRTDGGDGGDGGEEIQEQDAGGGEEESVIGD